MGFLYLNPVNEIAGTLYAVILLTSLAATCFWLLRVPSWLPRRWSLFEDGPRRFLLVNLILQSICLIGVLLFLQPIPSSSPLDLVFMIFFSIFGIVALTIGAMISLIAQILSFKDWIPKALSSQPQSFKNRLGYGLVGTIFGGLLVVLTLYSGYLGYIVLGLMAAFAIGACIIGVSPTFLLMRQWEKDQQQKIIHYKRQIKAIDWKISDTIDAAEN